MIRIRPLNVGVFSGEQIGEPGKWLIALGRDEAGGVVIAEADSEREATGFLHDIVAALKATRAKLNN
jgi:hypothetical protein